MVNIAIIVNIVIIAILVNIVIIDIDDYGE